MKRILSMGMVLILLFATAGCAKEKESAPASAAAVVHSEADAATSTLVENQSESAETSTPEPQKESAKAEKEKEKQPSAKKETPKKETPKKETPKKDSSTQGQQKEPSADQSNKIFDQIIAQTLTKYEEEQQANAEQEQAPSEEQAPAEPSAPSVEQPPAEEIPAVGRNAELEAALVGDWYHTVDLGAEYGVTVGRNVCTEYYNFWDGKVSISLDKDQMRIVLKNVMTEVYQELGAAIDEASLEAAIETTLTLVQQMQTPQEYTVYGDVLWFAGMRQGQIVSVDADLLVIKPDENSTPAELITFIRVK